MCELMYLRKSRADNDEPLEEVLKRHEMQLQEYAVKEFGHRINENNIYREIVSGETLDDRPEVQRMFKRLQSDDIKRVLVVEPSRLTRGDLLDCGTVVHLFRYTNTLITTPLKEYNLSDKYDRKFFEMELTRGNDYLEYTKEILSRGYNASVREGNYLGSTPPYGYRKVKIGKSCTLEINEDEAKYVRLAYDLYLQGNGVLKISHKLNELGAKPRKAKFINQTTVREMLVNPVYIGKIRWKYRPQEKVYRNGKLVKTRPLNEDYELIEGKHPPIISEEIFNKAQEIRGTIPKVKREVKLINPYAGLVKCKKCGKAIVVLHSDGTLRYQCREGKRCENVSSLAHLVQDAIKKTLKAYLKDFKVKLKENIDDTQETHDRLILGLQNELKSLEDKQEELYDFLESGIYTKDVFLKRNEKLAEERERLTSALDKAKKTVPAKANYENKCYSLQKALDLLNSDEVSVEEQNLFLKEIIEVIYYEKNKDYSSPSDFKLEVILK